MHIFIYKIYEYIYIYIGIYIYIWIISIYAYLSYKLSPSAYSEIVHWALGCAECVSVSAFVWVFVCVLCVCLYADKDALTYLNWLTTGQYRLYFVMFNHTQLDRQCMLSILSFIVTLCVFFCRCVDCLCLGV